MTAAEYVYEAWHHAAKNRDTAALVALYADDAEFESPLVPVIMNRESGLLRGREEILAFLEEGTRRRPNDLVRWYRDGRFLADETLLVWEHPRMTPNGQQVDILELMELEHGKIRRHRIYWGWFGTQMLLRSALAKQA